jgi:PAS domain S-box-containing protein
MTAPAHATDLAGEILDATATATVAIDREGNIVRCNQAAARLTGISPGERRCVNFTESVIFPDDLGRWNLEIERAFGGLFSRWLEIRWICLQGRVRPLVCSFSPVRDGAGTIVCVTCTAIPGYSAEYLADRALEFRDIGRFLHDTVAQELAALACALAPIEKLLRGVEAHDDASAAIEMATHCCRDIRLMGSMLAAPVLCARTVEHSMENSAAYWREEAGLAIVLDIDPVSETLPAEARILLTTVFQQWCARSLRRQPRPELTVRLRERRRGITMELEALAQTDGLANAFCSGWRAVRERARALGGEFNVSRGAAAARVRLVLPVWEEAR